MSEYVCPKACSILNRSTRLPLVCALQRPWLEHVERLQSLRKLKGKAASAKVLKAVDAVLSQVGTGRNSPHT